MTPDFITQYHPLTARPFRRNKTYEEHIPCKQLRPYVACFWSSEGIEKSGADGLIRVIPDTCMDIMIEINYTQQVIKSCLCGIQDDTVMLEQGKEKEETVRFAVRFTFWAVRRFLKLDMSDLYNQTIDLDLLMPGCNVTFEELFYCRSLEERIAWMESYLLGIHGLGLGGVWCGVASSSDWRKLLIAVLELPSKLEPASVIAFGWPGEEKELRGRWEPGKIHYEKW